MDIRQGRPVPRLSNFSYLGSLFHFLCLAGAFSWLLILANCASPGEPVERKPPIPLAIADLAAQQIGNSVSLTFTLPQETVERRALKQPPTVEVYREFQQSMAHAAEPNSASPPLATSPGTLLVTIPQAMLSSYVTQGRFNYIDTLRPEDFAQHPNAFAVYTVRTRVSAKRESADSNMVSVRIYPLPDPIADLKAAVTHSGIELTWTAPLRTPVGPAPTITSYRIYRSQAQPAAAAEANPALLQIGETTSSDYLDSEIQFGNSFSYTVRSVIQIDSRELASADSNRVTVLARDIFPPAAPQGLVVVYVPAQSGQPARLELSWNISVETDLAGYNVYRSEEPGVQGTRLNSELLPTPAFQDAHVLAGRTYFYTVTAVDHTGNESAASSEISGAVPAESQSVP